MFVTGGWFLVGGVMAVRWVRFGTLAHPPRQRTKVIPQVDIIVYRCGCTIGHLTVREFAVTGVPLFLFALLVTR